jgi:hypothetical protein
MRILSLLCGIVIAAQLIAPSARAQSESAVVHLQLIQCKAGAAEEPQILVASASEYPALKYEVVTAATRLVSTGYYESDLQIPEGNYFFKAQSRGCSNYLQAAVLSSQVRLLSMPLFPRVPGKPFEGNLKLFDEENALAGTLPVRPQVMYLAPEFQSGRGRVVDMQEDSYYIERVRPGKYTLTLEFHGGYQSEVPIDLSGITSTAFVKRDLAMRDIRSHIGNILPDGSTLPSRGWCY